MLAACIGYLVGPTPAGAVITIGSSLKAPPDVSLQGNLSPVTVTQTFLSLEATAPTPVRYFTTGRVVRWRIRTGDTDTGPVSFRIIRSLGGNYDEELFTGVATSSPVSPPLNSISTYPVDLPITTFDLIGIDCCYPDFGQFFLDRPFPPGPVGEVRLWGDPPLADGDTGRPWDDQDNELEMEVNADIEPTNTFSVNSVAPISGGGLSVEVTAPNDGTVVAGDPLDTGFRATSVKTGGKKKKGKKKRKSQSVPLLHSVSATASHGRSVALTLTPTRSARRLLHPTRNRKTTGKPKPKPKPKRISASVKIVYTPDGGTAAAQTLGVTLIP